MYKKAGILLGIPAFLFWVYRSFIVPCGSASRSVRQRQRQRPASSPPPAGSGLCVKRSFSWKNQPPFAIRSPHGKHHKLFTDYTTVFLTHQHERNKTVKTTKRQDLPPHGSEESPTFLQVFSDFGSAQLLIEHGDQAAPGGGAHLTVCRQALLALEGHHRLFGAGTELAVHGQLGNPGNPVQIAV